MKSAPVYRAPTELMVDCRSPDPTNAINGFLWNMNRARELGFLPSNAHTMAEHFFRDDVRLVFYSSAFGTIALCADDDALDADESFEVIQLVIERVKERRRKLREEREAASAIEAASAGETRSGSTEGESAVGATSAETPEDDSAAIAQSPPETSDEQD
jgi:hypothetical protein